MSLATITWPHDSVAATTPNLSLNHQDTVAVMNNNGIARFGASFVVSSPQTTTLSAQVFPALAGTAQLLGVAKGVGPGSPVLATSNTIQLSCVHGNLAEISVVLEAGHKGTGKGPCGAASLALRLPCQKSTCDGVYPVQYTATNGQSQSTTWVLLSISNAKVLHPINSALLFTLDAGSTTTPATLTSLLRTIASFPTSQITIATNYQALEKISVAPASLHQALRYAVDSLNHRIIATPSTSIDFGQLSANGLDSQVQQQLNLTNEFLYSATGRNLDSQIYLRGTTPVASLQALAKAGVTNAIIAESSLPYAPSSTYTWGSPFTLAQVPGITAMPTFGPINQLLTMAGVSPANRANAILAMLAFLHFEAPNFLRARSIVIPVNARSADPHFLTELIAGLGSNIVSSPANLSSVLAPSLIGANGAPTTQYVSDNVTPTWRQDSLAYLDQLITEVSSFNQSITDPWLALTLMERLANAEQIATPDVLNAALTRVGASLSHQYKLISVDTSAITLTARHSNIPVTLLSRTHYPLTVQVQLLTEGLTFPKGSTQLVTIHSQTKSLRFPAVDVRGSSLTLRINILTKDGQFVISHEVVQVRFAGASLVGYLLTFFSALVLALWWIRTTWRRRKEQKTVS